MANEGRGHLSSDITSGINDGQWNKINLNVQTLGTFDTTNYRYNCPSAGKYLVSAQVKFETVVANKKYGIGIFVNGYEKIWHVGNSVDNIESCSSVADVVKCNENDYIELKAYSMSGNNEVDASGNGSPANSLGKYTKMAVTKLHD